MDRWEKGWLGAGWGGGGILYLGRLSSGELWINNWRRLQFYPPQKFAPCEVTSRISIKSAYWVKDFAATFCSDIFVRIRIRTRILGSFIHYLWTKGSGSGSHKTVEIKVFLHFFTSWWKDPEPEQDPDPYLQLRIRMRIQEAQKHTDPTDPEPDIGSKPLKLVSRK